MRVPNGKPPFPIKSSSKPPPTGLPISLLAVLSNMQSIRENPLKYQTETTKKGIVQTKKIQVPKQKTKYSKLVILCIHETKARYYEKGKKKSGKRAKL